MYERRVRRDYARLRAYNTLLEQIYHRVYATSQLSGNTASILYSVPPFILGLPKLDMEDCIVYLVWQLRQAGFEVRFTWPNMLWISWKHTEGDYLAKQNPIIQAMIPEPPPAPKATNSGGGRKRAAAPPGPPPPRAPVVAFNNDIDIINSGSFTTQAPRRAGDYVPPASFVQNLERPGPGRESSSQGGSGSSKTNNVLSDLWAIR